jgi:SAM-dependent methyltransferase
MKFKPATIKLCLISFIILFLELSLIRYIPSQIRYVSYFSNIILLASFFGIGIGTIFWKKIKLSFALFPIFITIFIHIINLLKYDLIVISDEVVYFNQGFEKFSTEPVYLMPLIFFLTVIIFILPSKLLADFLNQGPKLRAYSINIIGSILGTCLFSLFSFLGFGPILWFLTIIGGSLLLINRSTFIRLSLIYLVCLLSLYQLNLYQDQRGVPLEQTESVNTFWSPYYKISLLKIKPNYINQLGHYMINVNNIGHQQLLDNLGGFYQYPYSLFPNKHFSKVLIIGSGGGNDVAQALNQGSQKVVAVEIDPVILQLGKNYHPLKPYSSDKVQTVVDDGRSYMARSKEKFDLIIYALTDSLTLSSANTNLRLESYLFTKEAFEEARQHLTDDGMLVLYNYYRSPWIVDKLNLLLESSFKQPPIVLSQTTNSGPAAVLIASRQPLDLPEIEPVNQTQKWPVPTDDWPFLYLKSKGIPRLYWSYLGAIIALAVFPLLFLLKKNHIQFDFSLFFMGAAFMLLETKNIVQFSLLFGSTWFTNFLVFSGLLVLVLFALWIAEKFPKIKLRTCYWILILTLLVSYIFPQKQLLGLNSISKIILSFVICLSPVLVANVIFARLFKKSKTAPLAYGANIIGSFVGGIFEYSSLYWGYRNLTIFIALFYLLSFLSPKILKK